MSAVLRPAKSMSLHSQDETLNFLLPNGRVESTVGLATKPVNVTNFFQNEEGKRTPEEQRRIAESNAKPPPKPKTVHEMALTIMHILGKYRLSHRTHPTEWPAKSKFLKQTEEFVASNQPIHLVLPGFPCKSPNKETKVIGVLPDSGEEVALAHINGLAAAIEDAYPPGAKVFIVSDGLMYNDIFGVSDQEVWKYGCALRQIAQERGLKNLGFLRLHDLIEDKENDLTLKLKKRPKL